MMTRIPRAQRPRAATGRQKPGLDKKPRGDKPAGWRRVSRIANFDKSKNIPKLPHLLGKGRTEALYEPKQDQNATNFAQFHWIRCNVVAMSGQLTKTCAQKAKRRSIQATPGSRQWPEVGFVPCRCKPVQNGRET